MPDLLFELFSEEIPARMQRQAAADLQRLVTNALVDRGLTYEGAKAFATPRRLALHVVGLPARQPDTREERKGPRVGSNEGAVQGFLKSAGLSDISQAKIESDPKKGEFYVAVIEKKGGATLDVLAEILPAIIRAFPWPKSMRWGAASTSSSSLRWVRPLRSIVATFGAETEEPEIVPFEVDGIKAGNTTYGHRFMKPEAIQVRRFDDYVAKLEAAKVVLDAARRQDIIRHDARDLAFAQGLEVIEDEALLEEVAGLVEWPVVLMGSFEEEFLDVPAEVIRATIRANQKCFVLRKPSPLAGEGAAQQRMRGEDEHPSPDLAPLGHPLPAGGEKQTLANRFLMVANIAAKDGGATIIGGNERVIRARLSDAKFFWDTDRKVWKDDPEFKRLEKFKSVTFHEKLGSQWERIERLQSWTDDVASKTTLSLSGGEAKFAARICKADLQTEVVGEFPEVQGLMGRKYATILGLPPSVAAACEEHYKPVGPMDTVPSDPVSVAVALADKLDVLTGFWLIDEKPTGSKDPYALRRAALGVIRLLIDNQIRTSLLQMFEGGAQLYRNQKGHGFGAGFLASDLLSFFHDRLKVMLRDSGARHDLVDAVLAPNPSPLVGEGGMRSMPGEGTAQHPSSAAVATPSPARGEGQNPIASANDDLLLVVRRVEALGTFLDTEDGKSLLAGFKRAANILRAEEKKDGEGKFEAEPEASRLIEPEERALHGALAATAPQVACALAKVDFEGAMRAMSTLRAPVDAFFEAVLVNADDPAIRTNRLALLASLRRVTRQIADFSKISG